MKLLSILFCLIAQIGCRKLVFVQTIFRHGARYPVSLSGIDSKHMQQIKNNLGQLTPQGKNMQYILGKALYEKYWKRLFKGTQAEDKYYSSQIYVRSTNVNRTIQSVQAQMQGLLYNLDLQHYKILNSEYSQPPFKNLNLYINTGKLQQAVQRPIFTDQFRYHAIPIHTGFEDQSAMKSPNKQDFLLKYQTQLCPKQKLWIHQNINSDIFKQIEQLPQIKQFLQILSSQFPNQNITLLSADHYISNTICIQYITGKPLRPFFINEKYKKTLNYIRVITLYLLRFYQQKQYRTASSDLFSQIVQNINHSINQNGGPKLVIYSAHDITLAMILATFNLTNVDCINEYYWHNVSNEETCITFYPQFASSFIIEVYQQKIAQKSKYGSNANNYSFQILFNNVRKSIPFCNWQYSCPLQQLLTWINSWKIDNFTKQCLIQNDRQKKAQAQLQADYQKCNSFLFTIAIVEMIIIMVLLVLWYKIYAQTGFQQCDRQRYDILHQEYSNQDQDMIVKDNNSIISRFYKFFN